MQHAGRLFQIRATLASLLVLIGAYEFVWNNPTLSLDGYSHLYNSFALRQFWNSHDTAFHSYYQLGSLLTPNWLATLALVLLESVLGYEASLRVLHGLLAALSLCGLMFLVRSVASIRDIWPELVCIFLPLIFSTFLVMGLHGFMLGFGLSFFFIGTLLRMDKWPSARGQALLGAALIVIYYSHGVPFIVCGIFFGSRLLLEIWDRFQRQDSKAGQIRFIVRAILPWLLPAAVIGVYASRIILKAKGRNPITVIQIGIGVAGRWLTEPSAFVWLGTTGRAGVLLIAYCAILFAACMVSLPRIWNQKRDRAGLSLILFTALLSAMFIFIPDGFGEGSYIKVRVLGYVVISWILLACFSGAAKPLLRLAAWICAVPYMIVMFQDYDRAAASLRAPVAELLSMSADIPAGSRLLSFAYDLTPGKVENAYVQKVIPESHFPALFAIQARSILLNNYEGHSFQFPLHFRRVPEFKDIINHYTPEVREFWRDLFSGDAAALDEIDYVFVWGVPKDSQIAWVRRDEEFAPLFNRKFTLVRQAEGASRTLLYRRTALSPNSAIAP